MELTYRKAGEYLIPNLEVPESPKVGKYGMLRCSYLRKNRQGVYMGFLLSGKLNKHLEEVDWQADEMVERLVSQMVKLQGVTEELKAQDQLKWVGLMNNIRAEAEEIVLKELIYD